MKSNQPSICFIAPFMGPLLIKGSKSGTGGVEGQYFIFGKELAKRKWRVVFIAQKLEGDLINNDFEVRWVNFSYLGGRKWNLPFSLILFLRTLKEVKTDYYVISLSPILYPLVFAIRCVFKNKVIFWGQTSTDFDRQKDHEQFWIKHIRWYTIRKADYVIVQTEEQGISLLSNFNRVGVQIPNIIYSSIDHVKKQNQEYIFWCGNTTANKRPEIFLELARLNPHLNFVMAANSTSAEKENLLKTKAKSIHNLVYLGSVPFSEIDDCYCNAMVYVNTSVREGFPNTFLEACRHGVPILSVNINPDKIIQKHNLGLCLYSDDNHLTKSDEEIANRLSPLLMIIINNRAVYSANCSHFVKEYHSPEIVVEKLIGILTIK